MKPAIALLILAAAFPALAQQPHKCKTAAGYVYQDRPCKAQAPAKRPSEPTQSANQPPTESAIALQSPAQTSSEREKSYLADRAKTRRQSDIKYEIDRLEESIIASQQTMAAEIAALEYRKSSARNNLAGAVYLQSLSAEMQAVTNRHGIDISTKQDRVKKLREDLAQIK